MVNHITALKAGMIRFTSTVMPPSMLMVVHSRLMLLTWVITKVQLLLQMEQQRSPLIPMVPLM